MQSRYRDPLGHQNDTRNHPARPPLTDLDIDLESAALIAKLQLEDLEEVYASSSFRKGKGPASSPLTDEELAYNLQHAHLQEILRNAEDAALAKSIQGALRTDEAYLNAFIIAEAAARSDREAAERLQRDEPLPERTPAQMRVEQETFVMYPDPPSTPPIVLDFGDEYDDSDTYSSASDSSDIADEIAVHDGLLAIKPNGQSTFEKGKEKAWTVSGSMRSVDCTICTDPVRERDALRTDCDHFYCRTCVVDLIESFTKDESLFPLRCCKEPIPISRVIPFLSIPLVQLFEKKHAEFSVSSKDRVYCVSPRCSRFLGSSAGITQSQMTCLVCNTSTCPKCKQAAHPNELECGVNAAVVELHALARKEGWQTCPGCYTLVELSVGCYHMTCRCREQFCYLCAVPWKNCMCPQWDEDRLIIAAQQRVENELGPRRVQRTAPEDIMQRVFGIVDNLRSNHDCVSHSWRYRHGGGRCEGCLHDLPQFLLLCRNCSMLACVRCTRNRL